MEDLFKDFGSKVFGEKEMKSRLPRPVYLSWKKTVANEEMLDRTTADAIAHAMKLWALEHHVSGLIHISEISDGFVKDISKFVTVGDVLKLKVLECDDKSSHVKLSLKALQKAHSRNRRKPMGHKPSLPNMKMGFQTIANAMSEWIKEAKETILK